MSSTILRIFPSYFFCSPDGCGGSTWAVDSVAVAVANSYFICLKFGLVKAKQIFLIGYQLDDFLTLAFHKQNLVFADEAEMILQIWSSWLFNGLKKRLKNFSWWKTCEWIWAVHK